MNEADLPAVSGQDLSRWVGKRARRAALITPELIDRFADISGDRSPIHMSEVEARSQGFEDRVAHGLLLGALVSSIVGNELPGAGGVLQGVDLAFRRPCLAGDEILIELEVVDVFESVRTLEMKVSIRGPRGVLATGRVRSGLREKRD